MKPPDKYVRTKADERAIDEQCYWDQKQAAAIIKFTEKFYRPKFIRGPIQLVDDQRLILESLKGWRLPNGNARFRFANLHVCKKAIGKTLLCSILSKFELFASGEPSPIVYAGACSRENASQIFEELSYSIEHSPLASYARIKTHTKQIEVPQINGTFKSVASDGRRLHGHHCSLVALDECHEMQNSSLWDSLRYSTKARPNGLVIAISTAGSDFSHFYYKIYQKSKRILSGEDTEDITHFAYVTEMDQDGNPEEESQWVKANPLLGSAAWCSVDQFRRDLQAAKSTSLGAFYNFIRLNLNKWIRPEELCYFDVSKFDELKAEPTEEELKDAPAAIGFDGSDVGDPSSCTITWQLEPGRYYSRSCAWVAEKAVTERDKADGKTFREFPELTITPGSMIDERPILAHLVGLIKIYNVKVVNYDPRGCHVLANRVFEETGVKNERVPPSARWFNPAMVELRKAIEEKRFTHDGSGWLKFCLQNVRISLNRFQEVYPVRGRSIDKIDCAISQLLSLLGLLAKPADNIVSVGCVLI